MDITIKDVAKAAGTSVSTVSKVINGHYSISEKTAARVRQVMQDLNYYPSASAQSFAKGATKCVALLMNLMPNAAFENPHMFEIAAGLEERLHAKGYRLFLCSADATDSYEKAKDIILSRSADALAIHVSVMTYPLSSLLLSLSFPHIVLGSPNFETQVCWIDNNNVYSGTIAARHLLSRRYKRIAFVGGQLHDLGSTYRLQGVRQELENAGHPLDDRYVRLGESTRADGVLMTAQLLTERPSPDAIICANNYIALGCVDAIHQHGMKIPRDIGVITFDNYPFSQIIDPPLTVVGIDVRDMGVQAANYLLNIIHQPNMQVQTYSTTSNLIDRQSTAPLKSQ